MDFRRRAGNKYIDRGDVIGYDFSLPIFTTDGDWHTLSLSAIVPTGAKIVHINLGLESPTSAARAYFRNSAFNSAYNALKSRIQAPNTRYMAEGLITLDANRCLEYELEPTTWTRIDLCVRGWFV